MLRRIKTQQELRAKQRRNKFIIGVVLILTMVFSTVAFSFLGLHGGGDQNSDSVITEKGIEFYRQQGVWVAEVSGQIFQFQHLPSQVEDVEVEGFHDISTYANQVVYFANDEGGQKKIPILTNLHRYIQRYQDACLGDHTCTGDLPTKNCTERIIIFEESDTTRVSQQQNCVHIQGDYTRASDAFTYQVLNIR